jgi:AcrR family transcriptional regulator
MSQSTKKRERLIEAARCLIHQQGFKQTTLAQIAQKANVPLGNVYYYYKTKEAIGEVVLDDYQKWFGDMVAQWEREADPKKRLHKMLDMVDSMADTMAEYGCPIGSLAQELDKARLTLTQKVDSFLKTQIDWVGAQFRLIGLAKRDATDLGIQFIAMVQGTILLAQSLHDSEVVTRQVQRIKTWVDSV